MVELSDFVIYLLGGFSLAVLIAAFISVKVFS